MRKGLLSLGLASGLLLTAWADATACGDKFLVIGRGRRTHTAARAASILIYMNPKTELPEAMRELQIPSTLKQAGHKTRAVESRAQVEAALQSGKYDLVLAALSDMIALEPEVASAPSRPSLLPVIYNPTGEELAAAERAYSCVMRSPSKNQHFLAVIDDAMELRRSRENARKGQ